MSKEQQIIECNEHVYSQPGCNACVKESEYFLLHWREMYKDAEIAIYDNEEDDTIIIKETK